MDAQTAVLIQNLADRLGTTSEYLWAVLIKQAPISGTVDLVMLAITILALIVYWKNRAAIAKVVQGALDSGNDGMSFVAIMGSIVLALLVLVWIVSSILSIGNVVTAFLNPEYWALDRVLNAAKGK